MSVNEAMIFLSDVDEFTSGVGEFIALEVARGAGVAELHELHPDRVPNPIVVNRWRRKYPAFDVLMGEAEVAAAQKFAWEVVSIADDESRQAAQAGNAMKARQWLAGKLHERYGNAPVQQAAPVNITNMVTLTDEQLRAIAGSAIDGEYALVGKDLVDEEPAAVVVESGDTVVGGTKAAAAGEQGTGDSVAGAD